MPNVLTMNDEDFLKEFNNLPDEEVPAAVVETPAVEEPVVPEGEQQPPVEDDGTPAPEDAVPEGEQVVEGEPPATPEGEAEVPGEQAQPAAEVPNAEPPAAPESAQPKEKGTPPPSNEPETPVDYKAAYEQLIGAEFKAGGKMIKVQSVEEARQLMQMGVGFHQNMSKIAPHRRIIETLKDNGLLEESKINELIDISKKNPEAIAALVQSAGLEPHQLIPSGDAQPYTPGDHVLPEAQLLFRTSVDNIREQGGEEFLAHVAQDWDVTSRAEIYKDPTALDMIYSHKQMGIYDQISSEVERRKVFDPSVAKMPFIHAYLAVGNEMNQKGMFAPQQEPAAPAVPPAPVAVKPAVASHQPVTPNPAAAKAASVRATPAPATATPNYLTMSDEEFMKHHKVT